jgi:hypothetical protein
MGVVIVLLIFTLPFILAATGLWEQLMRIVGGR